MYQRKVDVDMLNAVKGVLAGVSSVSPSSEQRDCVTCLTYSIASFSHIFYDTFQFNKVWSVLWNILPAIQHDQVPKHYKRKVMPSLIQRKL